MDISTRDFNKAIKIANDAGKRGKEIDMAYIPPQSATQDGGAFVIDEYTLSASGVRA